MEKKGIKTKEDAEEFTKTLIGDVLGRMSILDTMMSFLISKELSSYNKGNLKLEMYLLNNVKFDAKVNALEKIIVRKGYLFLDDYPKLANDLRTAQKVRNSFAHSLISAPSIKDFSKIDHFIIMHFGSFEGDSLLTKKKYTLKEHKINVDRMDKIQKYFIKLFELIDGFEEVH
jgi:hypothetical protein